MITYQDLMAATTETDKIQIIMKAIDEHKSSDAYKEAVISENYYKQKSDCYYRDKYIIDFKGRRVKDEYSPDDKICSNYYDYYVTQLTQYLLSNGVTFKNDEIKEKIKLFDDVIQEIATNAQIHKKAYGFFNVDTIVPFSFLEFVEFVDEENNQIRAGVRFWQIDKNKPLRITLFEEDGVTEYIRRNDEDVVEYMPKRPYVLNYSESEASGIDYHGGYNYKSFPVVPLYWVKDSTRLGTNKGCIDSFERTATNISNETSDPETDYWVLKNCDGMTTEDDQKFLENLKIRKIVHGEGDEISKETRTIQYQAGVAMLAEQRRIMFNNFQAFDPETIAAGNVTATQIDAAYQPLDNLCDRFEYYVSAFIMKILELAGYKDDYPSYTRNRIANETEKSQSILMWAQFLDSETLIDLCPYLTPEQKEVVKERTKEMEMSRMGMDMSDDDDDKSGDE